MLIKLFTCYHKPSFLLKNDIVEPMHVGKAGARMDMGLPGDDTGDHISAKNPYFCELTAIYWIWKNVKADAVGLFHYRRFLNFRNRETKINKLYPSFLEEFGITRDNVSRELDDCDVILPKKSRPIKETLYEYYVRAHVAADMDLMLEVMKEKYPAMLETAEHLLKEQNRGYFANILITRKELFDEYAAWLFDILFEMERRIQKDVEARDAYQQRAYGFLAERMTSVFMEYKTRECGWKLKEMPCLFLEEEKKLWRRYRINKWKRAIMTAVGLGKKKWRQE